MLHSLLVIASSEGRSNPESFRGGTLDCFAAFAMDGERGISVDSISHCSSADTPSHPRGGFRPSFADRLAPSGKATVAK
jgi:hypothetical protein